MSDHFTTATRTSVEKTNPKRRTGMTLIYISLASRLCNDRFMKHQSKRDLEKHWAEQAKKAAKKPPAAKPVKRKQSQG
jgi:hypothetical protein